MSPKEIKELVVLKSSDYTKAQNSEIRRDVVGNKCRQLIYLNCFSPQENGILEL